MHTIAGQTVSSFTIRDSDVLYSDIEFCECYFQGCYVGLTRNPHVRARFHNLRFLNCSLRGSCLGAAIVDSVVVDGLATNGQLAQCFGALFSRTVIRGRIDRLLISPAVLPGVISPEEQALFDAGRDSHYSSVDWALDISQAEFRDVSIRGVPGHLIRRDPETQCLVTRESAMRDDRRDILFEENLFPVAIDQFLQRADESLVLVAPRRHPRFKRYLKDLCSLRRAGIAIPE
jgi:hypothetical protein